MPMDFIPPAPKDAEPTRALADHLGYGMVATLDGRQVFVLEPHACRQLLYELTDDKRWIED